uniref:Toll-like receptor 13 n=1 Tax=Cyclina sinensis TaxID=120566 RepID=A0A0A7NVR9_CYCSN|nr:toll-like receptor 13 [Cyclina sinensis]
MSFKDTARIRFLQHLVFLVGFMRVIQSTPYCHTPGTVANFSHQNLTYIPHLSGYIECLIFKGNFLLNVTQETFRNISHPERILSLDLGFNNIVSIDTNALQMFGELKYLYLSGNAIPSHDLKHLLGNISTNYHLHTLKLNEMGEQTFLADTFSLMEGTRLKELYLEYNNIRHISAGFLAVFKNLKMLVLSHNLVASANFPKMHKLYKLDMSDNNLNQIPNFCMSDNNSSLLPKLRDIYLNDNKIVEIRKEIFRCLGSLHELEIRQNFISVFPDDMLMNTPQLWSLNAEKNSGHHARIEPYAFRSKSLGVLKIGSNGGGKTAFTSVTETFKYLPKLIALEVSYFNMFDMPAQSINTLFSPLSNLKYLMCYNCQIRDDPKLFLSNKSQLNRIKLDRNYIENISNDTFKSNPLLKTLSINMNKIGHLKASEISVDFLNSLDSLDLSHNPFICDCDLEWFITWLKSTKTAKVEYYPQNYVCAYPANMAGTKLTDVHYTYRECHPFTVWEWVGIVGGPIAVVLAIVSFVLYRKRWSIKHYIYLMRKRRNYILVDGENFLYDAFVAYNQEDSDWVREHLLPVLEDEHQLKLCIHERDFRAGILINDNIVTCIEQSKKIIIILSNEFAKSGWCMFELRVAHSKHIEDEMELVVILLERINGRNMNNSMKTLLETTTYIEWTEDQHGQLLFWNQLKASMNK